MGHGWFLPPVDLPVGLGASDIQVADLQQDGLLDIVYTDRISGEVGVLENLGGGAFFAAGDSIAPAPGRTASPGRPIRSAGLEPGRNHERHRRRPSRAGGLPSLVALDPGSNTFGLLDGPGRRPPLQPDRSFRPPAAALVVRAIDFNGNGLTGLADPHPGRTLHLAVATAREASCRRRSTTSASSRTA